MGKVIALLVMHLFFVLLFFFLLCRLGDMVAMFRYSSVTTCTVWMPPKKLEFSGAIRKELLRKEVENVCFPISIYTFLLLFLLLLS